MTTRHLVFDRLHNFRDLGGYPAIGGRTVRRGLLYRSDSLGKLTSPADIARLRDLRVRTVIDLRYPWEIEAKGRVPDLDGLDYHNLSIEHRPYDQAEIDPDLDPWRYLADRFAEVAEDGVKEIRQVLDVITAADEPLVFHCASGKDRTGLIAALVLTLLGVCEDDIAADFALTEFATPHFVAEWHAAHPGRTLRWPGYGRAPETVIRLALSDLATRYGSVEGYITGTLGVDRDQIAALRARLLTT
ncbi:tyrosine-protein phosphatase [Streptomyces kaniharaensis]|uniref:Tyrosine-protein phosphatase n=1 Tax=Streptomyces kaniharaensis TaxID=212423 RepID=A0A6N7KMG5_9ACTN|nr:tyrosine-protein phosphatase [Streptomyces kaniharaensis]MQS11648.1 tyrosine-protein phosphatase [Streptomyces kaniharaensis]